MEVVGTGIKKSGDINEPVNMKTEAPRWQENTTPTLAIQHLVSAGREKCGADEHLTGPLFRAVLKNGFECKPFTQTKKVEMYMGESLQTEMITGQWLVGQMTLILYGIFLSMSDFA